MGNKTDLEFEVVLEGKNLFLVTDNSLRKYLSSITIKTEPSSGALPILYIIYIYISLKSNSRNQHYLYCILLHLCTSLCFYCIHCYSITGSHCAPALRGLHCALSCLHLKGTDDPSSSPHEIITLPVKQNTLNQQ